MFLFLKEFDICPGIITKAFAFDIFVDDQHAVPVYTPTGIDIVAKSSIKDSGNFKFNKLPSIIGKCFTFFKFLDVIVKIAIHAFSDPFFTKNCQQPYIVAEMVILILERMELSTGFCQIKKRTNRTHTSKATLLPSRLIVN